MSSHIVELQHILTQNIIEAGLEKEKEDNNNNNRYVARTAKLQQRSKDIELMLKGGYNPQQVSYILSCPLVVVEREAAKLEEFNEGLKFFMRTGRLP